MKAQYRKLLPLSGYFTPPDFVQNIGRFQSLKIGKVNNIPITIELSSKKAPLGINNASFIVPEHKDSQKDIFHSPNGIRQRSVRLFVPIAAIFNFGVWSQDVLQAYLQTGEGLLRDVHFCSPQEFHLPPNKNFETLEAALWVFRCRGLLE